MIKNKSLKTTLLVISIVTAVAIPIFFFIVLASNILATGRSCFYETYQFDCTKTELMNALEKFRVTHTKYLLPESEFLPSGAKVHLQYFEEVKYPPGYSGYLYDSDKNQIIHFYITNSIPILKEEKAPSLLDFDGVNEGLVLGNWKGVNDDFSGKENEEVKKEFEASILDKLGINYEKKGNSAPLFHNWFKHTSNSSQ